MKIKTYKKTSKSYEDIFTSQKETKEIEIVLDNGCIISIAEHQLGRVLNVPQVDVICEKGCYSMDFDNFLEKITS